MAPQPAQTGPPARDDATVLLRDQARLTGYAERRKLYGETAADLAAVSDDFDRLSVLVEAFNGERARLFAPRSYLPLTKLRHDRDPRVVTSTMVTHGSAGRRIAACALPIRMLVKKEKP